MYHVESKSIDGLYELKITFDRSTPLFSISQSLFFDDKEVKLRLSAVKRRKHKKSSPAKTSVDAPREAVKFEEKLGGEREAVHFKENQVNLREGGEKGKEKGKKHKGLSERVHKKGGVPKNSQELEAPVLREEVKPAREVVSFHAPASPRPAAREPRGLRNLGNTCYVNSVLQCLNAASPFVSALIDKTYLLNADAASRGEVTEEMAALVRRMRTEDTDIDSAGLLEKVRRLAPQFEDSKQNDARSFLLALLEFVHEDVKGPRAPAEAAGEPEEWREEVGEASLVSENLYGLAGYTMECGGRDVEEKELFAVLSLPVPDGGRPELEGLFGMVERDCFECLGRHKARVEVVRQPPIWMVHLDRFGEKEKRETSVGYEHQFRGYQLQAVLHHSGSLVSGHYWAQVKMNGEWFVCNDAKVARIEERDVGSSNTAYILFYAKC